MSDPTICLGYGVTGLPVVHLDWHHSVMQLHGVDERICVTGGTVVSNRNDIVRKFLRDTTCDYLLMSDVDGSFAPDSALALAADDKPIVGALAFAGTLPGPMYPTIYGIVKIPETGGRTLRLWPRYPKDTLIQVHATGGHFLLIRRDVLTAIEQRFQGVANVWFAETELLNGDEIQHVGEDVTFCMRAGMCGFETWVDTRVKTGHFKTVTLTEDRYDEYMGAIEAAEAAAHDVELVAPTTEQVMEVNRATRRALVAAGKVPR